MLSQLEITTMIIRGYNSSKFIFRSRCRHLHPVDLPKMKLATSTHFRLAGEHDMAMRTAAFLSAIKKGAHFIFEANPGRKNIII